MNNQLKTQIVPTRANALMLSLATLIFATFISACNHEPTRPHVYYDDPGTYRNSTFPLFNGNKWVYIDSNYAVQQRSNAFVRLNIMSIVGYTEDNGLGSWEVNQSSLAQNINYTIKDDTVYVNDSKRNSALLNPRIAFLPPAQIQDTIWITGPYSDTKSKVYPLGHTYTTPAGTFDSVYVYEFDVDYYGNKVLTYFRPSIGILCVESPGSQYVSRSVLATYVIYK